MFTYTRKLYYTGNYIVNVCEVRKQKSYGNDTGDLGDITGVVLRGKGMVSYAYICIVCVIE